jgi:hypothetical protein
VPRAARLEVRCRLNRLWSQPGAAALTATKRTIVTLALLNVAKGVKLLHVGRLGSTR